MNSEYRYLDSLVTFLDVLGATGSDDGYWKERRKVNVKVRECSNLDFNVFL